MVEPPAIDISCFTPAQADEATAESFKQLVLAAGEVNPDTLPVLYEKALVLGYARFNGDLVGVGAIKRPYPGHRDRVFRNAKSTMSPAAFTFELGWFHVVKTFEGNRIASRMVEQLMLWAPEASVYATSRIDNDAMHAALIRRGGFVPEGSEYPSTQGNVAIRLFIRHTRPSLAP